MAGADASLRYNKTHHLLSRFLHPPFHQHSAAPNPNSRVCPPITPARSEPPPAAMSTAAAQGGEKPALRKPVFTKVDQLRPGTNGHTLTVKVATATPVPGRARPGAPAASSRAPRIAECLVGDETGAIVFTARNEQVDLLKPGATVILRNAKIDMFKGSMRLAVDKWGRIEATEPASFAVKEDNNLSLVEYELVNVAE